MSADSLPRDVASVLSDGGCKLPLDASVVEATMSVALEVGELQRESFRRLGTGSVRTKSSRRDLVTDVDVACERLIVERLRALRPDWTMEAEEETSEAAGDAPHWIVDPIDGTVNFIHGIPMFCVSIALYQGGVPLFGIVHAPILGETFVAARGAGAYRFSGDSTEPTRLSISETTELADAVVATGFPYRRGELEHSNLENFNRFYYDVRGLRRMGSAALDLAFVAAARLDGYWELHLSPYDAAAGALLVIEAGGEVTDAQGGDEWLRGGSLVAGPAALRAAIAARVIA